MIRWIYKIYNPNAKRDKNGRIINDMRRRKESRRAYKLIKDGVRGNQQFDYKTGGRKFRVGLKGKVDMKGDSK